MHGAKNLNPVITLKNLLPPGRGPMLRDGPALAIGVRSGCHFRCCHPLNGNLQRSKREVSREPQAPCAKSLPQHDRNPNSVIYV